MILVIIQTWKQFPIYIYFLRKSHAGIARGGAGEGNELNVGILANEERKIAAELTFGEAAGEEDLLDGIFTQNTSDLIVLVDDGDQIGVGVGAGFTLALEDDVGDGDVQI